MFALNRKVPSPTFRRNPCDTEFLFQLYVRQFEGKQVPCQLLSKPPQKATAEIYLATLVRDCQHNPEFEAGDIGLFKAATLSCWILSARKKISGIFRARYFPLCLPASSHSGLIKFSHLLQLRQNAGWDVEGRLVGWFVSSLVRWWWWV